MSDTSGIVHERIVGLPEESLHSTRQSVDKSHLTVKEENNDEIEKVS